MLFAILESFPIEFINRIIKPSGMLKLVSFFYIFGPHRWHVAYSPEYFFGFYQTPHDIHRLLGLLMYISSVVFREQLDQNHIEIHDEKPMNQNI